jgi:hypothetical protein
MIWWTLMRGRSGPTRLLSEGFKVKLGSQELKRLRETCKAADEALMQWCKEHRSVAAKSGS